MQRSGHNENESALASRARKGDTDALVVLLQANWSWLKGLIYNILQDGEAVEEVLQNICLLTLNKIGTLREPELFKGWLATVARNAALSYRQQHRRQPMQLDEQLAARQLEADQAGLVEQLGQKEQYQQLLAAMEQLPEKYREVFILKHLEEMSYAGISEILDIPITTVQIRLVRGRRMIYNRLTGKPSDKVPRT